MQLTAKLSAMAQKKIQDIYPLSPMQQGMLFHSLLEPDSGAYIIQTSFEMHGQLDITAFSKAWQYLLDRHSILRTVFVWDNLEEPLQVVGTAAKVSIVKHNWQEILPSEQQNKLEVFLQELKTKGFNLNKAPLIRLDLIKLRSQSLDAAQSHYQFIWTYHHLLLDGWSVPLLIKELLGYYQSLTQGLTVTPTPAIPYKNYIAWLKQQDQKQALEFWRDELKNIYTPTTLGISNNIDRQQDSVSHYQQCELQLSAETTYKLEFLAREYHLTSNVLVQAAWAILLYRYSGDNELVFGATSSGRSPNLANSQGMIGLFINTLPVRVQIDAQQLLVDWLKQLQAKQITRQEYEYTSLIDIHRVSNVSNDTPLFQSIIVFENYPVESSLKQSLAVLDIRNIQIREQTNYPLTLYVAVSDQISFKLLYKSTLFDDGFINNLLQHLKVVLEGIASNPKQKVGNINILTPLEQEKLLNYASSTTQNYIQDVCFHQVFEAQVSKNPNATAAIYGYESITYQQLNDRADIVASHLQKIGVKSETLVGICCDRSLEMLIGLLAIFKAGGAYVPLDPHYPQPRLDYILEDSQLKILLTQTKYIGKFSNENLTIINSESYLDKIESLKLSSSLTTPENLAYVIYTSGSTGKPKGVQVSHRSLINFLDSMREKPGITAEDTLLSVTTISFDIAALELYLPLLVGATVVIAPADVINSDRNLAERIEYYKITMMQATPITWRMLLVDNWQGSKKLKILSGGEALESHLAKELLTKGKEVWNLYGPTETTIWSSIYQVKETEDQDIKAVSIGKTAHLTSSRIFNTQLYILDSQLSLVPPGAIGELYIGGAGLARGYLNQADLTAERFVPNPFIDKYRHGESSARLYKTGDRVRQLPNGNLEYVGRIDNQVKLRSFRIELGEIEAILSQNPAIEKAIIAVRGEDLDTKLTAYILPQDQSTFDEEALAQLRFWLQEKLPRYMIPSNYFILEALPLTPNGKIDRGALPVLESITSNSNTSYKKPQSEIERAIAEIWQNTLQVERVSLTDNFFDLGGQSLLMIRVHSLLKEKLKLDISLVDMFRYPTVVSLAEYCDRSNSKPKISVSINKNQLDEGKNRLQQRRKIRKV